MKLSIVVAAHLSALALQVSASAQPFLFRTLALSGQHAPGTPNDVVFSDFQGPAINEDGTVAFRASLAGPGVVLTFPSNVVGIWRDEAGVLTKVIRSGEQAVGLPPGVVNTFPGNPKIDAQGNTAFLAGAPGESTQGMFSEGQGSLRVMARELDQVPGLPSGAVFELFSLLPLMNNAGQVAFTSFISGAGAPSFTEGLFTDRSGPLTVVLKEGDSAPGISGANVHQIGSWPSLNDHGVLAFSGRYTGGAYPNDHAVWTEHSGAFSLRARSGQAAPGLPDGVVFSELREPRINNASQVLFHSRLTGPGITLTNDEAIYI